MLKRAVDIGVSLFGLILLFPFFILISILIKLDSKGTVFYKSTRVGKREKNFKLYKFRTMQIDAEKTGPPITYNTDPRITRIGKILRKAKADELPQLLNVLNGEMSLVGPRPEAPIYVEKYTPEQKLVLSVKPGITGLAQIEFPAEETMLKENTLQNDYLNQILPRKLELDLQYIRGYSVFLDLKILFQTLGILISKVT